MPPRDAKRTQPDRDGRVRWSAWLGGILSCMEQIVRQQRKKWNQRVQENEMLRHSRPHPPAAVIESSLAISGHQTMARQDKQIPRPAQPQPRGEPKPEVSAADARKILKAFEDGLAQPNSSDDRPAVEETIIKERIYIKRVWRKP